MGLDKEDLSGRGAAVRTNKKRQGMCLEATESVLGLVDRIVGLEEDCALWIDERIGSLKSRSDSGLRSKRWVGATAPTMASSLGPIPRGMFLEYLSELLDLDGCMSLLCERCEE